MSELIDSQGHNDSPNNKIMWITLAIVFTFCFLPAGIFLYEFQKFQTNWDKSAAIANITYTDSVKSLSNDNAWKPLRVSSQVLLISGNYKKTTDINETWASSVNGPDGRNYEMLFGRPGGFVQGDKAPAMEVYICPLPGGGSQNCLHYKAP